MQEKPSLTPEETTRLENLWSFRFLFVVLVLVLVDSLSFYLHFYISEFLRFLLIAFSLALSPLVVPSKHRKQSPPPGS